MKRHVLIISNNTKEWESWPGRLRLYQQELQRIKGLDSVTVTLHHTRFHPDDIPLERDSEEPQEREVALAWLSDIVERISKSYGVQFHYIIFHLTHRDWKTIGKSGPAGHYYGSRGFPQLAYVIADEKESFQVKGGGVMPDRLDYLVQHELGHQTASMTLQQDLTHFYCHNGRVQEMWDYYSFETQKKAALLMQQILKALKALAKLPVEMFNS